MDNEYTYCTFTKKIEKWSLSLFEIADDIIMNDMGKCS